MSDMRNFIHREIERALRGRAEIRIGVVDGYDPQRYAARVLLLPEESLTGWLPIGVEWMGNGWGLLAPVGPGDQVVVEFQEADKDSGIITKRLFDSRNVAPAGVPYGECWLVHKSGTYLKLTNDGKLSLHSATEIDVGDLLNALQTLCTKSFHDWVETHVHSNGNAGGNTGVPTTTPPADSLTSILKAN